MSAFILSGLVILGFVVTVQLGPWFLAVYLGLIICIGVAAGLMD